MRKILTKIFPFQVDMFSRSSGFRDNNNNETNIHTGYTVQRFKTAVIIVSPEIVNTFVIHYLFFQHAEFCTIHKHVDKRFDISVG